MDSFGRPNEQQPSTSATLVAALQRSRSSEPLNPDTNHTNINNNSLNSSYSLSNGFASSPSSFGPVRNNMSSMRAHRSPMYSRPNCLGSLDRPYMSNRYFGNANRSGGRSVMLGTKKVSDSPVGEPELTSTAQRIIRSLQTVETPIVNKEKVAMDSIKSVRPDLSYLKRKEPESGPPVLRNPFELSPQNSLAPPSKAPRMENNLATDHERTKKEIVKRYVAELIGIEPRELDELEEEYDLGEPWSSESIARGVRHMEHEKIDLQTMIKLHKSAYGDSGEPRLVSCGTQTSPSLNPATISNSFSSTPSITSEVRVNGGQLLPTPVAQDAKWECPTCMVVCKMSDESCVCCGEANPNRSTSGTKADTVDKGASQSQTSSSEANKPLSEFKFGFASETGSGEDKKIELSNFKFGETANQTKSSPQKTEFKFGFGTSSSAKNNSDSGQSPAGVDATSGQVSIESSKPAGPSDSSMPSNGKETTNSVTFAFNAEAKKTNHIGETISTQTKGFTFGLSAADEERASETSSIKLQPLSGFRFGLSPAKPTVTSDKPTLATPKVPERTWRCNICRDDSNLMTQMNCRGCDALRQEPSNSTKQDTGKIKKDFSFQPFFGLKEDKSKEEEAPKQPFVSQLTTPFTFPTPTVPTTTAPPSIPTTSNPLPTVLPFTSPARPTPAPASSPAPALNTSNEKASPGEKRKADTFTYSPSEPKLKMKSMSEVAPAPQSEMKTGSFLDALKRQAEDRPDGGNSNANSSFTGSFLSSTSTPVTATSASTAVPNSNALTSSVPTTKPFTFQFGPSATIATTPQPSSIFGSPTSAVTTASATPTPSLFGTTTTPSIFGAQPTVNPTPASQPTLAPPPSVFQFGQPTPATTAPGSGGLFVFGQSQAPGSGGFRPAFANAPSIPTPNMFGQPSANPTPSFGAATPAPMFTTTPNLNFGAAAQPAAFGMPQQPQPGAPALFNLGAQPTGERKFKKAVRRFK